MRLIAAARKIFPRADSAETDLSAFLRGSLAVEAAGGADSRTEDPAGSSGVQRVARLHCTSIQSDERWVSSQLTGLPGGIRPGSGRNSTLGQNHSVNMFLPAYLQLEREITSVC